MILKVENLIKSFRQGREEIQVLKGINFQLQAGETCAIVGHSGSGKSTLLSLLAGLDDYQRGEITFCGRILHQLKEKELTEFRAQNMSIVFQQFHLMRTLSALENVSLPLEILRRTQYQKLAREALSAVGLENRLDHYPHQLSGGECQRVAIARAFVVHPQLLLADEPSGNLDDTTGAQVMEILFKMVKEKKMAMILVTHDKDLADKCQRQLHLHNGVLQEPERDH